MSTNNAINSPDIDGGTLTGVTVASDDKLLIQDTSDGNRLKTVPVSSVSGSDPVTAAFAYALVFGG